MKQAEFWQLLLTRKIAEVKDVYRLTPLWAIGVFIVAGFMFSFFVIAFLPAWRMRVLDGLIVIFVVSSGMLIGDNVGEILKSKQ